MPENLGQFLTWLGSDAAIGAVISLIFFNWAWFQKRESGQKVILLVVVSLAMGIGSHLLTTYVPAGVVSDLQPYYKAVVSAVVVLMGSQAWHSLVNKHEDKVPLSGVPLASLSPQLSVTGGNDVTDAFRRAVYEQKIPPTG